MRSFKVLLVTLLLITTVQVGQVQNANAQCAMCSFNAENSVKNGNTQGAGLNDGILFLLSMPFLALAGIGFVWYKKYRTSDADSITPFQE